MRERNRERKEPLSPNSAGFAWHGIPRVARTHTHSLYLLPPANAPTSLLPTQKRCKSRFVLLLLRETNGAITAGVKTAFARSLRRNWEKRDCRQENSSLIGRFMRTRGRENNACIYTRMRSYIAVQLIWEKPFCKSFWLNFVRQEFERNGKIYLDIHFFQYEWMQSTKVIREFTLAFSTI